MYVPISRIWRWSWHGKHVGHGFLWSSGLHFVRTLREKPYSKPSLPVTATQTPHHKPRLSKANNQNGSPFIVLWIVIGRIPSLKFAYQIACTCSNLPLKYTSWWSAQFLWQKIGFMLYCLNMSCKVNCRECMNFLCLISNVKLLTFQMIVVVHHTYVQLPFKHRSKAIGHWCRGQCCVELQSLWSRYSGRSLSEFLKPCEIKKK